MEIKEKEMLKRADTLFFEMKKNGLENKEIIDVLTLTIEMIKDKIMEKEQEIDMLKKYIHKNG